MKYDEAKLAGIYKITNLITGKFYIGSATYVKSRLSVHKFNLRKNKHDNSYLQRSWNKYGEENFKFEIIEIVNDINKLVEREQIWLDWLKPYERNIGYNLRTIANLNLGIKRIIIHSEETKIKIGNAHRGKIVSLETRQKISAWQKGIVPIWATKAAAIKTRNKKKWPCEEGYKCRCIKCKETRNNYIKQWRAEKRA